MNFSCFRTGIGFVAVALFFVTGVSRATEELTAKIKTEQRVYAGHPVTLDGSASTQGEGVTYLWQARDGKTPIDDASKSVARFTPPAWGGYTVTLTVTRGTEHREASFTIHVLNDPGNDQSPVFEGARKLLYKQAPDALGGTAKLYLHVFNPPDWKAGDKRPVVLLFHGGGWGGGSPERYVEDARYWASRGLVGIAAQYRLGQREGTQPQDCVADAKSAVRYVRAHASELGIDPGRIAVGGESAGAHIAACTGTVPAYNDPKDDLSVSCIPNALLLYFPYQMVSDRGNRKDDMSPLHFVGLATPPTLFIAGEFDAIAPAERGIEWGNQMKGDKNLFRFFIYSKAHHPSGKHDFTKPGVENDMIRQTDLFLAAIGFVKGEPTVAVMDLAAVEKLHVAPEAFVPLSSKKAQSSPWGTKK